MTARQRLLWTIVLVSACSDGRHAGEKGVLSFQFGLFGCTLVDARGATLATSARTALVVTDEQTKTTNTLTVRSETPGSLTVTADGGVSGPSAVFELACQKDNQGVCTSSQGGALLVPVADGKVRLVFERDGTLVDALTVSSSTPVSLSLRNAVARNDLSFQKDKSITVQAILKDSAGVELVATDSFEYSVTEPLRINETVNQSGVVVMANDAGIGQVTAHFGALAATANVEATP